MSGWGWGGERKGEHLDNDMLVGIGAIRVGEKHMHREENRRGGGREREQGREVTVARCGTLQRAVTLQAGFPVLDILTYKPAQRCRQNNQSMKICGISTYLLL